MAKMNAREILRNPFETEQEIKQKESTLFGNPYQKFEKPSNINDDSLRSGSYPLSEDGSTSSNGSSVSSRISLSSFSSVRSQSSSTSMKNARLRSTSPSIERQASTSSCERAIHRIAPLEDFQSSLEAIIPRGKINKEYLEARRLLERLDISICVEMEKSVEPQTPPIGRWVKDIDESSIMEEVVFENNSPTFISDDISMLEHADGSDMILKGRRMSQESESDEEVNPAKRFKFDMVDGVGGSSDSFLVENGIDDDGDSSGTSQGPQLFSFTSEAEAKVIVSELFRRTPRGMEFILTFFFLRSFAE